MPNVYAIGDLHLCLSVRDKSMEVFGSHWAGYLGRLETTWRELVTDEDLVLVPGDVSWAMKTGQAQEDLSFLGALPGKKVLLRGNHDYWWSSYHQVCAALPGGVSAIQNNVYTHQHIAVAGSRGWLTPVHAAFSEARDGTIFAREMIRLKLSLDMLSPDTCNIVMLHYPPFSEKGAPSPFAELIAQYPVRQVVYGHLHGQAAAHAFEGEYAGIPYALVSADHLAFRPKRLLSY